MGLQQWIDKLMGRGQTAGEDGTQEQRGDGGTSYYRPNMNKRSVTAKMPEDNLTGQFTLDKLRALTRKQETGQNTGYAGSAQNASNGNTSAMEGYPDGTQDGGTGNLEGFHRGYTGSIHAVHSGFTGMEPLGDSGLYYGTPGNGVDAAYGYNSEGGYPGGGNAGGYNTDTGYSMNGYAASGYGTANGWNTVPNNVSQMPLSHTNPDMHVERVMVLTSMRSCYDAICHMKDKETLILSLDSIGDKNEAERWKYLLQGAAFTLKCTVATLPGSGYMLLVAPYTVTLLQNDDRGTRDLRMEAPASQTDMQDTAWQNSMVQPARRARRTDANPGWTNYDTGSNQNSYYGQQPASPDMYSSYGGYGSK